MTTDIQLLRSSVANKRPDPTQLLDGQAAINTNVTEPGLFFKLSDNTLSKIGPVAITTTGVAPNATPAGSTGNAIGETWLDSRATFASPVMKVWNGTGWVTSGGFTVDATNGNFTLDRVMTLRSMIANGTGENSHITVPTDTTANRPVTPTSGMFRFNTTDAIFEGYDGNGWRQFVGSGGDSTLVDLTVTGDTILGDDCASDTLTINSSTALNCDATIGANAANTLEITSVITSNVLPDGDGNRALGADGSRWNILGADANLSGDTTLGNDAAADSVTVNAELTQNGTTNILGESTVWNRQQLRFSAAATPAAGAPFVSLRAPSTLTSGIVLTLPDSDGQANQVLSTDGSGNLSWTAGGGGVKGQKGEAGQQGDLGPKGNIGQKGQDGAASAKGQKGEVGTQGQKGDDGTGGDKGQKGADGSAAAKGQKGADGAAGTNGDKGQKGDDGTVGQKGETGSGDKGQKGDDGTAGTKGQKGDDGTAGTKGDTGQKGEAGAAGNPGGADTQVQFNNGGAFAGDANFTFNADDDILSVTEIAGDLNGPVIFAAKSGEALAVGDVVFISGTSGNFPVVSKAQANSAATMPAMGVVQDAATGVDDDVNVVTLGTFGNFDTVTPSWAINDTLFVSATVAGGLQNTPPATEANLIQNIGKVMRVDASVGSFKVGGAGRTNATPNLNDGNIFVGNASNQAEADAFNDVIEAQAGIAVAVDSLTFDRDLLPSADNTIDLGSAAARFANIFTGDLHLKNDRGDWTVIEEEDFLSVRNNKTGKIFKLSMEPLG